MTSGNLSYAEKYYSLKIIREHFMKQSILITTMDHVSFDLQSCQSFCLEHPFLNKIILCWYMYSRFISVKTLTDNHVYHFSDNHVYAFGNCENGRLGGITSDQMDFGKGTNCKSVSIPRPIFGALHCVPHLSARHWHCILIAGNSSKVMSMQ